MKHLVCKVSTLMAVLSVGSLQPAFADVSGEVVEANVTTGALTVRIAPTDIVAVGEPVVAYGEVDGKTVEIAQGEVIELGTAAFTAIFDSADVSVGAKTLVKQSAPQHEADHLSAIPEDIYAVVEPVVNAKLDVAAAASACRAAIKEFPREARFYAQLGRVLEVDGKPASAILQYQEALALRPDYPVALHSLAKLRFYGPEELRDFGVARKHFNRAAELGLDASMPVIGTMCRDALGGDRDYAAAANWFSIAAEKGNPFSQNALAECFEQGWGLDKDISKALLWYRSSAELGYVPAYRNLGRVFAQGIGVTASASNAFDWYSRAAEKGDLESQYQVGLAFLKGDGVVFSQEHALEWLTKAAEAGHAKAMREIAGHYYSDGSAKEDLDLAAAWFKKAAEKGDVSSQYSLGAMYEKGEGISRDKNSAINWYRKAARQGHSESQKRLVKLKAEW